jgi:DNA primase
VSAPVRWDDLESDVRAKFDIKSMRHRLSQSKQPAWEDFDEARTPISRAMVKKL